MANVGLYFKLKSLSFAFCVCLQLSVPNHRKELGTVPCFPVVYFVKKRSGECCVITAQNFIEILLLSLHHWERETL